VQRQAYGYLPNPRALLLCDWHQITLLGDRSVYVNNLTKSLPNSDRTVLNTVTAEGVWHKKVVNN